MCLTFSFNENKVLVQCFSNVSFVITQRDYKTQVAGPRHQSFLFRRPEVGPNDLHFSQVPRWWPCCWCRDQALSTTALVSQGKPGIRSSKWEKETPEGAVATLLWVRLLPELTPGWTDPSWPTVPPAPGLMLQRTLSGVRKCPLNVSEGRVSVSHSKVWWRGWGGNWLKLWKF